MMKKLKQRIIFEEQFKPGWIGLFINPFYFARKGLYENISALAKYICGKTLDVGCGLKPYEKLFTSTQYIGLEIDTIENRKNKKADFFYNGITFPFSDEDYDSVISNQVFEHVFNPDKFMLELNRVLKPGGMLLITVPFVWDEHDQPHDYARYTSFALESILNKHGFEVIEHIKSMNDIRVIFQLLNDYIYKKIVTDSLRLNLLLTIIFMAPINVLGELLSKILPKNDDLYLDNIILAKKIKIDQITNR